MELLLKGKLNLANHWLEATMARQPQASPQLARYQNALTGTHELYRAHKRTRRLKIWIQIPNFLAHLVPLFGTGWPFEQLGNVVLHHGYPDRTSCWIAQL
jgi:hypothetical protein